MKKFLVGVLVIAGFVGGTLGFYQDSNATVNTQEQAAMRVMRF